MEEAKIREAYKTMYDGMVLKDKVLLDQALDPSFVLVHMTGMHQDRQAFIHAILNGTLNYYSADHESIDVRILKDGKSAELTGHSYVNAAVFGGGKHSWRLAQEMKAKKTGTGWKLSHSVASTY